MNNPKKKTAPWGEAAAIWPKQSTELHPGHCWWLTLNCKFRYRIFQCHFRYFSNLCSLAHTQHWFFFCNIYIVVARRIFLEGRCYESVPIDRFLFLIRVKKWIKVSATMFVEFFYLCLWSLTIIGGIIKVYSYYMVPYIIAENPDLSPNQAITLSRRMMQGHKWECFIFEWSYAGWFLLGIVTFDFRPFSIPIPIR